MGVDVYKPRRDRVSGDVDNDTRMISAQVPYRCNTVIRDGDVRWALAAGKDDDAATDDKRVASHQRLATFLDRDLLSSFPERQPANLRQVFLSLRDRRKMITSQLAYLAREHR